MGRRAATVHQMRGGDERRTWTRHRKASDFDQGRSEIERGSTLPDGAFISRQLDAIGPERIGGTQRMQPARRTCHLKEELLQIVFRVYVRDLMFKRGRELCGVEDRGNVGRNDNPRLPDSGEGQKRVRAVDAEDPYARDAVLQCD